LTPRDDVNFDDWFDATFSPHDGTFDWHVDKLRTWARRHYAPDGSLDPVAVATLSEELITVNSAVALVPADLATGSTRVPATEVHPWFFDDVRISVDGGYTAPSLDLRYPFDVAHAAVEVVEYMREQLSQDRSVSFPVCGLHDNFYLHPMIDNGAAVWRCNRGGHVVAAIGELHQRH
jgi:hypothetical protein